MIETAKEIYATNRKFNSFRDWYRYWIKRDFNPSDIYLGVKLEARVNHGRWVVDCPFCKGAETIWPGEPFFLCAHCANNRTKLAIRIELPKERVEIEKILDERLEPENKNWTPGETLAQLKKDIKAKGVV